MKLRRLQAACSLSVPHSNGPSKLNLEICSGKWLLVTKTLDRLGDYLYQIIYISDSFMLCFIMSLTFIPTVSRSRLYHHIDICWIEWNFLWEKVNKDIRHRIDQLIWHLPLIHQCITTKDFCIKLTLGGLHTCLGSITSHWLRENEMKKLCSPCLQQVRELNFFTPFSRNQCEVIDPSPVVYRINSNDNIWLPSVQYLLYLHIQFQCRPIRTLIGKAESETWSLQPTWMRLPNADSLFHYDLRVSQDWKSIC